MRNLRPIEYRCYLVDFHGQIVWRHKFLVSTDAEAIATAQELFRDRCDSACGFELWQNARYLHCEADAFMAEDWVKQVIEAARPRRLFDWLARGFVRRRRYVGREGAAQESG